MSRYAPLAAILLIGFAVSFYLYRSDQNEVSTLRTKNSPQLPVPLSIDKSPPPLPSIPTTRNEELQITRGIYGGVGDKPHLGGFTDYDINGLSNNTFNWMFGPLGIKSVLDVGCGKGVSTSIFRDIGAKVLCIEGSHDAVVKSLLPPELIVEHDFSRGPWWPEDTFDAAWVVEFVEHVGRQFVTNYIPAFRQAALVFVTHSAWGGWHHVEVHADWWWRTRYESFGLVYSDELTRLVREQANAEDIGDIGQHIRLTMQVFLNPAVASLPQHQHLMAGYGCFNGDNEHSLEGYFNNGGGIPCKDADALPARFESLLNCKKDISARAKWQCTKNNLVQPSKMM